MRRYGVESVAREIEFDEVDEGSKGVLADGANVAGREIKALKVEQAGSGEGVISERGQGVVGEV